MEQLIEQLTDRQKNILKIYTWMVKKGQKNIDEIPEEYRNFIIL